MASTTNHQKHKAGRYLVAGEALLRGYDAALVGPQTYVSVNGHKARVQVAAKGDWQILDVDAYTSATDEFVILVDVADGARDFYICPGSLLRTEVRKRARRLPGE